MSSRENDIVINPHTQRPIKVGGRIWLKLHKEGILDGEFKAKNEIYTIQEDENEDEIQDKINHATRQLPDGIQAVRGRGKYAGKIVKRKQQPTTEQTTRRAVRKTAEIIQEPEIYENLQNSDDFQGELEELIMREFTALKMKQVSPHTSDDETTDEDENEYYV